MPKFDPKDNAGSGSNAEIVPAGRYGLALVWFTRRTSRAGTDYLSVKYEITDGPMKGKSFFSMIGLDLSQNGTRVRWSLLCQVCGVQEEFELGSSNDGTAAEGDENIARLFKFKPFRGEVTVEKNGEYTNNTVARIIKSENWTRQERDLMAQWETEQAEARDDFGMPPDDAPGGVSDEDIDREAADADPWDIPI